MGHLVDVSIKVHLDYAATQPCEVLAQITAARLDDQVVSKEQLFIADHAKAHPVAAEEGIGERHWVHIEQKFECTYEATVQVSRLPVDLKALGQVSLPTLPAEVIKYLMPSRFCHPEEFQDFVAREFGAFSGGALIGELRDWIEAHLKYVPGASNAQTTAHDSFRSREGVCRDYAHVLIAMARAVAVPARMVSCYAPDVTPQDFHAVVEVYLDDTWRLVDPTGMAKAEEIVRIGVGCDASDISFLTAYGFLKLNRQTVEINRV